MPHDEWSIDVLDTNPLPSPGRAERRRGGRAPVALLASVALLVVVLLQSREAFDKRLGPTPPPPPPPVDHLVGLAEGSLVTVSTVDGAVTTIELDHPAIRLATGSRSAVVVHDDHGRVLLVRLDTGTPTILATGVERFEPSATPGRFWRDDPSTDGRLVETDATGQVYASVAAGPGSPIDPRLSTELLEDRRPLAATAMVAFAERCDERRCRVERRSLLDGASGVEPAWQRIGPSPKSTANLAASPDGRWLTTSDQITALYRQDSGGVFMVFTDASASAFSPDSETLYVISRSGLNIVDLVGDQLSVVPISQFPESLTDVQVISIDQRHSAG